MSKAIRWQIHFHEAKPASENPKHYRVDIYDEQDGSWSGITQLTAGDNPFTTTEDNSDDFFCPVRSQTGTLQICTALPGGGTITLNDLLPANNIARPVRVSSIASNNAETIEWQGFLSCEAYSQDYTSIPENISIPVISVLEAMASVEVDESILSGLNTVASTINTLIDIFLDEVVLVMCDEYYIPSISCGRNIVSKYIDATVLFQANEYNNENSMTYIVSGMSIKDCLARIATYMGWCLREKSYALYFEAAGETSGYRRNYRQGVIDQQGNISYSWMIDTTDTSISRANIADQSWRGTGHERSIAAGAKSVEVVANLAKYNLDMQVPECPVGLLSVSYNSLNSSQYLYELGNSNAQAYSNYSFAYYWARCFGAFTNWEAYGQSTFANVFSHMAAGSSSTAKNYSIGTQQFTFYAGSFLARYCWENSSSATAHDVKNALHCVFFPRSINAGWEPNTSNFVQSNVGAIFSMSSVTNYRCNSGYIRLYADADSIFMLPLSPNLQHHTDLTGEWFVAMELRIGNRWWNGASWQYSQCTFNARMTKSGFKDNWDETMSVVKTSGLLIPIPSQLSGIVTFKVWPLASSPSGYSMESQATLEMIFSRLNVDHLLPDDSKLTDRGANHYYRLLGTNFRDEISVSTDLASGLNNVPSPSLIMDDSTTPMTMLDTPVARRWTCCIGWRRTTEQRGKGLNWR